MEIIKFTPGDTYHLFYVSTDFEGMKMKRDCGIVEAKVVYVNDNVMIVKTPDIKLTMDIYANALEYVEAWYLHKDFIDKEARESEYFICIDPVSQHSLYVKDYVHETMKKAVLDNEHEVVGYAEIPMLKRDTLIAEFNKFQKEYQIQELINAASEKTLEQRKQEFLEKMSKVQ